MPHGKPHTDPAGNPLTAPSPSASRSGRAAPTVRSDGGLDPDMGGYRGGSMYRGVNIGEEEQSALESELRGESQGPSKFQWGRVTPGPGMAGSTTAAEGRPDFYTKAGAFRKFKSLSVQERIAMQKKMYAAGYYPENYYSKKMRGKMRFDGQLDQATISAFAKVVGAAEDLGDFDSALNAPPPADIASSMESASAPQAEPDIGPTAMQLQTYAQSMGLYPGIVNDTYIKGLARQVVAGRQSGGEGEA